MVLRIACALVALVCAVSISGAHCYENCSMMNPEGVPSGYNNYAQVCCEVVPPSGVIRPLEDCEELGDTGIVCHMGYRVYDVDDGCRGYRGMFPPRVWQCTWEFQPGGYTYMEFTLIGCVVNENGEKECHYDNGVQKAFAGRTYCTDDCIE